MFQDKLLKESDGTGCQPPQPPLHLPPLPQPHSPNTRSMVLKPLSSSAFVDLAFCHTELCLLPTVNTYFKVAAMHSF